MNKNIHELYTDRHGFVNTQNNLIQIKIWKFYKNSIKLIGTITFHYNYEDYIFNGIVNEKNYQTFIDIWSKYCLSDYIVKRKHYEWTIDFLGTHKLFRPYLFLNYRQFRK